LSACHINFKEVGFAIVNLNDMLEFNLIIDRYFISDWVYPNRAQDAYPIEIWEGQKRHTDKNVIIYVEALSKKIKASLDITVTNICRLTTL
jgi:hypothetical protein